MRCTYTRLARAALRASWMLTVFAACGGGGGDGGTGPGGGGGGGTPAFTLVASTTALTVAKGASGSLTVTVTRTGGFTGPVSLQATGMPSGVTALFSATSVPSGQTSSTLTISATAAAASGTSTITIVGNGAGTTAQTLTVQLTVTGGAQAGPFALSLSVSSYLALPPTTLSWMPELTITRNAGFSGPVTLSVSGQPPGMVAAMTPTSVTGNTARLAIINGGVPNGTYQITIRGVAAGQGEQSITLPVTVAPPTTGTITWQFCENAVRHPQWLVAVKDGAGPWTRIVPNGITYSFSVTSPTAQLALVTSESSGFRTTVYQYTAQEIAARAASECLLFPPPSTRSATVSPTGLGATDLTFASLGYWGSSANGNASMTLLNLPAGPLDLLAVRGTINAAPEFVANRAIIRRGLNPASGASLAALDFNAAEAFTPTSATWTFGNTNGEAFSISQHFRTAGGTAGIIFGVPGLDRTATTRTIIGIPTAQTVNGDLHQVTATVQTAGTGTRATRQIITFARSIADRTLSFGPVLPAPVVTAVAGAPARLRAQGSLPAEYNSGIAFDMTQASIARYATLQATRGFLGGGATYDVQMPDLTGVLGWDSNFGLRVGSLTNWWVSGGGPVLDFFDLRNIFASTQSRWTGAQLGVTQPADGATYLFGRAAGTVTP